MSWALSRCLAPKQVESAAEKGGDARLDRGGLLLEVSLPRGEEEDQLRVGENPQPLDGIVGVKEKVTPDLVLEGGQLSPSRLGTVAQDRDARRRYVVEREGGVDGRRRWRRCP